WLIRVMSTNVGVGVLTRTHAETVSVLPLCTLPVRTWVGPLNVAVRPVRLQAVPVWPSGTDTSMPLPNTDHPLTPFEQSPLVNRLALDAGNVPRRPWPRPMYAGLG